MHMIWIVKEDGSGGNGGDILLNGCASKGRVCNVQADAGGQ